MYVLLGFFVLLAVLFVLLTHWRVCGIRKKVCALTDCEKGEILNDLISPFGFSYHSARDLFSSRLDAWQKEFGYQDLYDQAAPHAQMVFQCEPVYFNAYGVTWLIEFWKGQYGINTGAEIGIYHADTLIAPKDYSSTLFHAAETYLLPCISMELWKKGRLLFRHRQRHWWLTGFLVGCFSHADELTLKATLTFPDPVLASAFADGLSARRCAAISFTAYDSSVSILFEEPTVKQPCERFPLTCRFSQWKNKWFCKLYLWATKPFCRSDDRLLYLYYFLPFTFRKTVQICKPRRYTSRRSNSRSFKQQHAKGKRRE